MCLCLVDCDHGGLLSLGAIKADTGCAPCRWAEISVQCEEHTSLVAYSNAAEFNIFRLLFTQAYVAQPVWRPMNVK